MKQIYKTIIITVELWYFYILRQLQNRKNTTEFARVLYIYYNMFSKGSMEKYIANALWSLWSWKFI